MPSTIIEVWAAPTVPAAQLRRAPKVTISRPGYATVTLPITDPRVEASDLAANWAEQARPGTSPLLGLAGGKLAKRRLSVLVDEDVLDRMAAGTGDVFTNLNPGNLAEACLAALVDLARPVGPPVIVAYSNLEAGAWRITDLSYNTTRRDAGDNRVLAAEVSIQLTEASDPPPIAIAPAAPPPVAAAAPTPPTTQADARRYTVKAGDTLFVIAQRSYGNGNVWQKIAQANSIRDPRKIRVGQVLTLP